MNNQAKVSITIVIFLLILALGAAAFYFISYDKERKARLDTEEQLNLVKDQKDKLQARLDEVNREKLILEEKVKENDKTILDLNEKLTAVSKEKDSALQDKQKLETTIQQLEVDNQNVGKVLNEKTQQLFQLQKRIDKLLLEKSELDKKIASGVSSNRSVEKLDKIIVNTTNLSSASQAPKSQVSGKVLLVNREYGFIVLNVGKQDNVELGDIFVVYHQDVPLGSVQVEKVQNTMSAANFLEGFKSDQVLEGDPAQRIN